MSLGPGVLPRTFSARELVNRPVCDDSLCETGPRKFSSQVRDKFPGRSKRADPQTSVAASNRISCFVFENGTLMKQSTPVHHTKDRDELLVIRSEDEKQVSFPRPD
eukprot:GHVR01040250.1.p2 GENE.GHVR01040250.1~~GHVR01040250.1.p2  ORF type:complete len:106 (+),score=1.74 GHVR01040250.1:195-512(+)